MNLTFTQTNTVDLLARKDEQGSIGADIRKELTRRKAVGLWIGPDFLTAKAKAEVEQKVFTKAVSMPAARKVEKKMAGRGR
jgi:hypothetical protein